MLLSVLLSLQSLVGVAVSVDHSPSLRLALGSCHDTKRIFKPEDGDVWDRIRERSPDAFVWGGDIIYGDDEPEGIELLKKIFTDFETVKKNFPPSYANPPATLRRLYNDTANLPQYKRFVEFIGQENIHGIWDDHDFGLNDAGQNQYAWRDESQQALLDFLKVPSNHPRRSQKGVYTSSLFLDGRVKLIMMDNRYHKDSYKNKTGDFLGEVQWKWLEQELNNEDEKVEVTLLLSGIQILTDHRLLQDFSETWLKFPNSKERLLRTISESNSRNVVLISGDIHYGEMSVAECRNSDGEVKFILPELTTSGMTHSHTWAAYPQYFMQVMQTVATSSFQYQRMHTLQKNFGEIDFFLDESDDEAYVILRVFEYNGEIAFESKFNLSQLKSEKEDVVECGAHYKPSFIEQESRYLLAYFIAVGLPLMILVHLLSKCIIVAKSVLMKKPKVKQI